MFSRLNKPCLPPSKLLSHCFFAPLQSAMTENYGFSTMSCFFTSVVWCMPLPWPGTFPFPLFRYCSLTLELQSPTKLPLSLWALVRVRCQPHSILCPSSPRGVLRSFTFTFIFSYEVIWGQKLCSFIPPNLSECPKHSKYLKSRLNFLTQKQN